MPSHRERHPDPEDEVREREEHEINDRESDRRGTSAERRYEDRVYGEDRWY